LECVVLNELIRPEAGCAVCHKKSGTLTDAACSFCLMQF
jgi:hypothetical protein